MVNSACTSCQNSIDKSGYWTPQLYYEHANGTFEEVPNGGTVAYYLGRGDNTTLTAFPAGFKMLSGDMTARSYNNQTYTYSNGPQHPGRPVSDRVSFACLSDSPQAEQPYMFDTNCDNGLRAQIHFQSCWNGKDLYLPNNAHVGE